MVDDDVYEKYKDTVLSARTTKGEGNIYVTRSERTAKGWRNIPLHREINNTPDGYLTDHANGDTLDNRRCNLRTATNAQNTWNSKMRSDNTSGYKGIHWVSKHKYYRCRIYANGKSYVLGYSKNIEDLVGRYEEAARRLHGNFTNDTSLMKALN